MNTGTLGVIVSTLSPTGDPNIRGVSNEVFEDRVSSLKKSAATLDCLEESMEEWGEWVVEGGMSRLRVT